MTQSKVANNKSSIPRSWHHRMAALTGNGYFPMCSARSCARAVEFICEWDQQQGKKTFSRHMLYCAEHAGNFAQRHRIYMADLPDVKLSQLETASRDDWAYGRDMAAAPVNHQLLVTNHPSPGG